MCPDSKRSPLRGTFYSSKCTTIFCQLLRDTHYVKLTNLRYQSPQYKSQLDASIGWRVKPSVPGLKKITLKGDLLQLQMYYDFLSVTSRYPLCEINKFEISKSAIQISTRCFDRSVLTTLMEKKKIISISLFVIYLLMTLKVKFKIAPTLSRLIMKMDSIFVRDLALGN
ncbi:GfV-B25-ORF1 [Ichnoviriform fumiferanae]|uniref:GfV-B25-ORF1 n=1 Tax=Ichnoviriform fumiferanae TaxID=419435 RepID=A2PZS4_9VIRU|nr:GfV-B25-ORF1 [Ichnoviriform fumiferanae]BAF45496.1 GfV-B25-ORF1 [Ichnoviriform fumiferanae]